MGSALALKPDSISIGGWLLIVIRVMLMVTLLLLCLPFYYLWRLLGLSRLWPRIFLAGVGMIAGVRVTIAGRHRPNALLLANHVSWLDIPAVARATGTAFVGHDGLTGVPLIKHLCEMNDTVFIARHDKASVAQQVAQVRHAIADTGALTIFPEGTTSDGTTLLPFKSSLLSAADPLPEGVAVQPAYLEYEDAPAIAWVGEEHGLDNFLRILARVKPLRLRLHFLPPLEGGDLDSRKTIAAAAQAAIERAMMR
jgi:1-acyl-sn-glycerol-3-phosphate acyltransferase